jgi:hypothetical protein
VLEATCYVGGYLTGLQENIDAPRQRIHVGQMHPVPQYLVDLGVCQARAVPAGHGVRCQNIHQAIDRLIVRRGCHTSDTRFPAQEDFILLIKVRP